MSEDRSPAVAATNPAEADFSRIFAGRRVVLGVTGGIAAYKAILLCRRLVDAGAHVIPVMTQSAMHFVGKATFDALASEPVQTQIFDGANPIPHTRLGQGADLIIVAPATARLIGSYAAGISDDLLTATLLATEAPVVLAPAMHTEMWEHPAVQANLVTLADRGVVVVAPAEGRLAGGDIGSGRLAEPEDIVAVAAATLAAHAGPMHGVRVLVSAGGTREPIDAVRYIGNRSSGKQGYALAEEAARMGAHVTLVATVDRPVSARVELVLVDTAAELRDALFAHRDDADIILMAAAVADFRPAVAVDRKIKKADGIPEVVLVRTEDILAALGASKPAGQTLVGFAAETDDLVDNAAKKLKEKGADFIVANDVSADGVGFAHDTNAVTILAAGGPPASVALASKQDIARAVLTTVMAARADIS